MKTGEHPACIGAVTVIVRPSAQDGIDLLEFIAKTGRGVATCQLLDFPTKITSLGLGDLGARAVAIALIPIYAEAESEELEPVRHGRDLRLFR